MWWTCREQVVIGSLKWHTPFSGRGPDTVYQNLKCFFWPRNFSCRNLFILRQGLCPMNGILEYRVRVMQSKFLVQSHFKITHTLLVCVEQLGRDKLSELYIRSLSSSPLTPCACILELWASNAAVASVMSDSVWPHRWQPTRLHRLWDSPGKNTGVGCHFLLQYSALKFSSCPSPRQLPSLPLDR